jgi:hypothetical protein
MYTYICAQLYAHLFLIYLYNLHEYTDGPTDRYIRSNTHTNIHD